MIQSRIHSRIQSRIQWFNLGFNDSLYDSMIHSRIQSRIQWFTLWFNDSIYNPGKKLVDFLNFQTFSPSPLIQCWYLGDMCCKSTLPEPTLFVGEGGGGVMVNSCFNWKMLHIFFPRLSEKIQWIIILPS
jgi:hypothetical protein